ncbi:MAG: plastocyanin/azurin family copper-binding protein [Verrucomicrobiota bacterium]
MNSEFENNSPVKGFTAFWLGMLAFVAFGVLSWVFGGIGGDEDTVYMERLQGMEETRTKVENEQRTAMAGIGLDLAKAAGVFAEVTPVKSSKPAVGTAAHQEMMDALMAAAEKSDESAEGEKKGEGAADSAEVAKDGEASKAADVLKITLEPEIGLKFKQKEFKAKAGQPVELTFKNNDPTMQIHNVLIIKPGTTQKVGMLANQMAADPEGMAKSYIPESDDVLFHSSLIQVGKSETIKFDAPSEPGEYPYICTFPGHWMLMQGKMIVE